MIATSMESRIRSRSVVRPTKMWVLGVFFTTSSSARACSAFCTSSRSPWVRIGGDRLQPCRGGLYQAGRFVHRYSGLGVTLGIAAQSRCSQNLLTMKVPKVRKKPSSGSSRRQRGGPRTDAEGYTAEAFGESMSFAMIRGTECLTSSRW